MTTATQFMYLDTIEFAPSVVFEFVDDVTSETVTDLTVSIVNGTSLPRNPVYNPSGYVLFYKLANGTYTFHVDAPGFEPWEETVVVGTVQNPLQFRLVPSPAYAFAAGTTLLRGSVAGNMPATTQLTIQLPYLGAVLSATPAANGEFLLYVSKLTNSNKIEIANQWFVAGPGNSNVLQFTVMNGVSKQLYSLTADPVTAQLSATEFAWEIGKELHITLTLT
jgi:hypothetical protein